MSYICVFNVKALVPHTNLCGDTTVTSGNPAHVQSSDQGLELAIEARARHGDREKDKYEYIPLFPCSS